MGISWGHILIILLIVLLLFGANRIPELARSFGKGVREFKKGLEGLDNPEEDEPEKKTNAGKKSSPAKKANTSKRARTVKAVKKSSPSTRKRKQ